jgi:phage shock protein A
MDKEIVDKQDYEQLCVDYQTQNKKLAAKVKELEEQISSKHFKLENCLKTLDMAETQLKQEKTKLKKTDLKLRQIQFT